MSYSKISDEIIAYNNARILSRMTMQERHIIEPEVAKALQKEVIKISDNTRKWLMIVDGYQYRKTQTKLYELAGFSSGTGSRIAKECEKRNFVKSIKAKISRGNPKYPVLLPNGYAALGIQEKRFYSKGAGYEHRLYQYQLAEHFCDYYPEIELNRNEKFIDVGIETNEMLLAIEVAMTSVHEKENLEKDFFKAQADYVIVACKDKKVMKEVEETVTGMAEEIQGRTRVYLISELLNTDADAVMSELESKVV